MSSARSSAWRSDCDDDREIIAVCSTEERANGVAEKSKGAEVTAFPLDQESP